MRPQRVVKPSSLCGVPGKGVAGTFQVSRPSFRLSTWNKGGAMNQKLSVFVSTGSCFVGKTCVSRQGAHLGVHADHKGVAELGCRSYILTTNPLRVALPGEVPDFGWHTTMGTTNNAQHNGSLVRGCHSVLCRLLLSCFTPPVFCNAFNPSSKAYISRICAIPPLLIRGLRTDHPLKQFAGVS